MSLECVLFEIVKYLNCLFEVFLLYYFLECCFPIYEDRRGYLFVEGIVAALAVYGINCLQIPLLNLGAVFLIYMCFGWGVFRRNVRSTAPYIAVCLVLLVLTEFVFHYIYRLLGVDYTRPGIERVILLLVQGIVRFVAVEMLRKNNSEIWHQENQLNEYLKYFFLLPAATIILLNGVLYFNHYPMGYILICLGGILLILSNISGFYNIEKMMESMNGIKEAEQTVLKTKLEQKHFQRIEEINQEYAQYVHEIRKAVRTVQQLSELGNHEEINRIAEQLQKNEQMLTPKMFCQDKIMNAILLERQSIARKQKLEFQVTIQPGMDFSFIEDMDRIVLFGNLLDNAIEAAAQTENGFVTVDIQMGNKALLICRVENNYNTLPVKQKNFYLSMKKEKGHGYGLKNISSAAEKYSGGLYLEEQEHRMIAVLTLSNVQKMDN